MRNTQRLVFCAYLNIHSWRAHRRFALQCIMHLRIYIAPHRSTPFAYNALCSYRAKRVVRFASVRGVPASQQVSQPTNQRAVFAICALSGPHKRKCAAQCVESRESSEHHLVSCRVCCRRRCCVRVVLCCIEQKDWRYIVDLNTTNSHSWIRSDSCACIWHIWYIVCLTHVLPFSRAHPFLREPVRCF